MAFNSLLKLLADYPTTASTFNQYSSAHPDLDRPNSAKARLANLESYLHAFAAADFVLVGEAAGYAGCRFSGIPFTCEAQLRGPDALGWTVGRSVSLTGRSDLPWVERSATMVWETLGDRRDCLLWNAFPWHPHRPGMPLSNRPPGAAAKDGFRAVECLLALFPAAEPVAIGRVAERSLAAVGRKAVYIRHPSRGGKRQFAQGVCELLDESSRSSLLA